MERVDRLNKHLNNLISLNENGGYEDDISKTITEINYELGINDKERLRSYSTEELHKELSTREGVYEKRVNLEQEFVGHIITGDLEETFSYTGPVGILVNRD